MAQDLYVVALFLNVLSALVIMTRSRWMELNTANYFLAGYTLVFTMYIFTGYVMYYVRDPRILAMIYGTFAPFYYLLGPLSFFYVRGIMTGDSTLGKRDVVHLLPAVLHTLNLLPYFLTSFDSKVELMTQMLGNYDLVNSLDVAWFVPVWLNSLMRPLLATVYPLAAFVSVLGLPNRLRTGYIYPSLKPWLLTFTGIQVILFGANFLFIALNILFGISIEQNPSLMPILGPLVNGIYVLILVLSVAPHFFPYILYGYIDVKGIATMPKENPPPPGSPSLPQKPSRESADAAPRDPIKQDPVVRALDVSAQTDNEPFGSDAAIQVSQNEISHIEQEIERVINRQKLHCNPTFSIHNLADALQVPVYKIRFYLRYVANTTWPEFRMKWRMQEAEKLLESETYRSYTIEALALECGYENRSTFYQHFREYFGMTPSDYIKNITDN